MTDNYMDYYKAVLKNTFKAINFASLWIQTGTIWQFEKRKCQTSAQGTF